MQKVPSIRFTLKHYKFRNKMGNKSGLFYLYLSHWLYLILKIFCSLKIVLNNIFSKKSLNFRGTPESTTTVKQ